MLIGIITGIPFSFGFMLPIRLFGLMVLASGFILFGWSFKYRKPVDILISTYVTLLKATGRISIENSSNRTEYLVVRGPYRHVRHPLYFGVFLLMLGLWLLLDYTLLLFSAIFLILRFNYVVTPFEEKELRVIFGKQYERYSREVARMIPFTKRLRRDANAGIFN